MADRSTTDRLTVTETSPDEIVDEWCSLLAACEPAYPFQHPSWHAVWWSHFGGERSPLLLTVRDAGRLAAVAPLMRDGDRLLFAGDPDIQDYMDLIVASDAPEQVYDALLDALAEQPWRELVLWGVPETSPTLPALTRRAQARGWQAEEEFEAV